MDGTSRAKLVKAGYAIYRVRDVHPVSGGGDAKFEIREMSSRGQWVLYGTYPTKAARERAWKELAQGEMNMMENGFAMESEIEEERVTDTDNTTEAKPDIYRKAKEVAQVEFEQKLSEKVKEYEFQIFKASSGAKISGALMRERMERLLRVMFLRETKEHLKPSGQWSRYCIDMDIDIKNADYEIDKLGDYKDELLLTFSSFCGYDINKIKYLTTGNSEKLGVTIENGEIFVKGERVPLTPEDMQVVVNSLQEDLQKQEEKAEKDRADEEKSHAETKKALKKAERELRRIKREAEKAGLTEEEQSFVEQMEEVRADFETLIRKIDDAGFYASDAATPAMISLAKTTLDYMNERLGDVFIRDK